MPKKYQKPENKNRKRTHNRPYLGSWGGEYCKEDAKKFRKYMKSLRHKLLFHIPLTEEEQKNVKRYNLTANTGLDRNGLLNREYDFKINDYKPKSGKTHRWRFLNPKEERLKL